MPADSPRIQELRRRVQEDPASIAFAQLAEECRRAGSPAEAVDICRAGLVRYPDYLSARVTLGRALIELDRLDEARRELESVLRGAPDNLAAAKGISEIVSKSPPAVASADAHTTLFDLERLAAQLDTYVPEARGCEGLPAEAPAEAGAEVRGCDGAEVPDDGSKALMSGRGRLGSGAMDEGIDTDASGPPDANTDETLAAIEQGLRAHDERQAASAQAGAPEPKPPTGLVNLERWLNAIVADRDAEPRADS